MEVSEEVSVELPVEVSMFIRQYKVLSLVHMHNIHPGANIHPGCKFAPGVYLVM